METTLDLFETVKDTVGCDYISDLRFGKYNRTTKRVLKKIDLNEYPTNQLIDMAEYMYGKKVKSREEAIAILKTSKVKC